MFKFGCDHTPYFTLAHHTVESSVTQWLEYPARSQRVVGSNPIWISEFFWADVISIIIQYSLLKLNKPVQWERVNLYSPLG